MEDSEIVNPVNHKIIEILESNMKRVISDTQYQESTKFFMSYNIHAFKTLGKVDLV